MLPSFCALVAPRVARVTFYALHHSARWSVTDNGMYANSNVNIIDSKSHVIQARILIQEFLQVGGNGCWLVIPIVYADWENIGVIYIL